MNPEVDQDDDGTGDGRNDEVTGLKAALEAERRNRQAAEGRTRDLETSVAELRGRIEGMATGGARPAEKSYSRAELRAAVEKEQISQDEADAIWEKQLRKEITTEAVQAAKRVVDTDTLSSRISNEISRYKAVVTDLGDKDSASFQKVAAEFRHLVDYGYEKDDVRTEIAALRAAFGPIDALEKTNSPRERRGHDETGGRGGGEGGEGSDGWPKAMSSRQRAYYEHQIANGLMDRAAAIAEFNYKPKHRPARGRAA